MCKLPCRLIWLPPFLLVCVGGGLCALLGWDWGEKKLAVWADEMELPGDGE